VWHGRRMSPTKGARPKHGCSADGAGRARVVAVHCSGAALEYLAWVTYIPSGLVDRHAQWPRACVHVRAACVLGCREIPGTYPSGAATQ
jgi:hypothetical protein